jgi:predicted lipid-binding transport protein (Tim44 family)
MTHCYLFKKFKMNDWFTCRYLRIVDTDQGGFMSKSTRIRSTVLISALLFAFCFIASTFLDEADARSRGGGRSFSRSKSYSRTPSKTSPTTRNSMNRSMRSSSFMRGLGGGLLGGFLGSMLFGGVGHAGGGGGGFGGSGIGLFEILIIGGIIFFLYKKFARRKAESSGSAAYSGSGSAYDSGGDAYQRSAGSIPDLAPPGADTGDPVSDPSFDQEAFKEFAQDVFFKVQAAWTRRDIAVMRQYLGSELLSEYEDHFADLKAKGRINKLENIAVRKVEIVDSGEMAGEDFIIVRFIANLLDYTVDEASGKVLEGDSAEPVKFDERWAFARPKGSSGWKLEGIQN